MYRAQVVNYIDKFLKEEGFTLKEEGDKTAQLLFYSKELNFITIGIRFLSEIYENNQADFGKNPIARICTLNPHVFYKNNRKDLNTNTLRFRYFHLNWCCIKYQL